MQRSMFNLWTLLVGLVILVCCTLAVPVQISSQQERIGPDVCSVVIRTSIPPEATQADHCQFPPKRGSRDRDFCETRATFDSNTQYYCTSSNTSTSVLNCYRDSGQVACSCKKKQKKFPHQQCFLYLYQKQWWFG